MSKNIEDYMRLLFFVLIFLVLISYGFTQTKIQGNVFIPGKSEFDNVTVFLTPLEIMITTNIQGNFNFNNIPNGVYDLYFFHPSCLIKKVSNIICNGSVVNVSVTLVPGEIYKDGIINIFDRIKITDKWQLTPNDPDWNDAYDLDDNNIINYNDIKLLLQFFDEYSAENGYFISPSDSLHIKYKDLSLFIPPGAFSQNTFLTIDEDTVFSEIPDMWQVVYKINASDTTLSDSVEIYFDVPVLSPPLKYRDIVIAFQSSDTVWYRTTTVVDSLNFEVTTKSKHFSAWAAYIPGNYTEYYETKRLQGASSDLLSVPYYYQGQTKWCYLTSLAMVLKGYGFSVKPQLLATDPLFKINYLQGLSVPDFYLKFDKLAEKYVSEARASAPGWFSEKELTGFIMSELDQNRAVLVNAPYGANHAFLAVGYDATGIFITDPSGALFDAAGVNYTVHNLIARHLSWQQWFHAMSSWHDLFGAPDLTLSFSQTIQSTNTKGSINLLSKGSNLTGNSGIYFIKEGEIIAQMRWDGKNGIGYKFERNDGSEITAIPQNSTMYLKPVISNASTGTSLNAKVELYVDGVLNQTFYPDDANYRPIPPLISNVVASCSLDVSELTPGNHQFLLKLYDENVFQDKVEFEINVEGNSIPLDVNVIETFDYHQINGQYWISNDKNYGNGRDYWDVVSFPYSGPRYGNKVAYCAGMLDGGNPQQPNVNPPYYTYDEDMDARLEWRINLTNSSMAWVAFDAWWDMEPAGGYFGDDFWEVRGCNGFSCSQLPEPDPIIVNPTRFVNSSNGWSRVVLNASDFAGRNTLFKFRFVSDGSNNPQKDGVYIDNVVTADRFILEIQPVDTTIKTNESVQIRLSTIFDMNDGVNNLIYESHLGIPRFEWEIRNLNTNQVVYSNSSNQIPFLRQITFSASQEANYFGIARVKYGSYESETYFTVNVRAPEPLTASISATPTSITAPNIVSFQAQVSGGEPPYNFEWDCDGDGIIDYFIENPTHAYIGPGDFTVVLTVTDAQQNSVQETYNLHVNGRPQAVIQSINSPINLFQTVILDGSQSFDPDGDPLSYLWTQVDGPSVTLNDPQSPKPNFIVTQSGTYKFSLIVKDALSESDPVQVVFNVMSNLPPIANAGPNLFGNVDEFVHLNGSNSYDPEGQPLSYVWTQVAGPTVNLHQANTAYPDFIPPAENIYKFALVVNDGVHQSQPDYVTVTVNPNLPPVAIAGPDQNVNPGELVQLDGSASYDPEGTIYLTYYWEILQQPPNSQITLSNVFAVRPTFTPQEVGLYKFKLIVSDGHVNSEPDYCLVRVNAINHPDNALLTTPTAAFELQPGGSIAWQYTPQNGNLKKVWRINRDSTLIVQNDRVSIIGTYNHVPIWEYNQLSNIRDADFLLSGNILILTDNLLREVSPSGGTVMEIQESQLIQQNVSPFDLTGISLGWAAERLENGYTVITADGPGYAIEVDDSRPTPFVTALYSYPQINVADFFAIDKLPNGDVLYNDDETNRILKLDSNDQIIWEYTINGYSPARSLQELSNGNILFSVTHPKGAFVINPQGIVQQSFQVNRTVLYAQLLSEPQIPGKERNLAPETEITGGPSGTIHYDDVTFHWSGDGKDDGISGYYYGLDDVNTPHFTTSTSKTFYNVSVGSHTFYVRAVDDYGTRDPQPAARSFTYTPPAPPPHVHITSPYNGQTFTTRTITVTGYITNYSGNTATMYVNGNSQTIAVSGGQFSATAILISGSNTIRVQASNSGGIGYDQKTVYCNAPPTKLWVQLTWSENYADVDLYVTEPDGSTAWWYQPTTPNGGYLDVDDVNGYGPEHYLISSAMGHNVLPGNYEIRVHYYNPHQHVGSIHWTVVIYRNEVYYGTYHGTIYHANSNAAGPGGWNVDPSAWDYVTSVYMPPGDGEQIPEKKLKLDFEKIDKQTYYLQIGRRGL